MSSPFWVSGCWAHGVYLCLAIPLLAWAGLERSIWNRKATCICSAICLPIKPCVLCSGERDKRKCRQGALLLLMSHFHGQSWMPSPVQPPGQHQHWVNRETNLCEIKTHFYMVPWHQDRHFLPTKQAQLSCHALWPLLLNERVADSLNPFRAPWTGDKEECWASIMGKQEVSCVAGC